MLILNHIRGIKNRVLCFCIFFLRVICLILVLYEFQTTCTIIVPLSNLFLSNQNMWHWMVRFKLSTCVCTLFQQSRTVFPYQRKLFWWLHERVQRRNCSENKGLLSFEVICGQSRYHKKYNYYLYIYHNFRFIEGNVSSEYSVSITLRN